MHEDLVRVRVRLRLWLRVGLKVRVRVRVGLQCAKTAVPFARAASTRS